MFGVGHKLNYNNFPYRSGKLTLKSKDNNSINAENNYWGASTESEIQASIYDYNDDFNLGEVDYTPFATSPNTSAPISPPKNVKITRLANSVNYLGMLIQKAMLQDTNSIMAPLLI